MEILRRFGERMVFAVRKTKAVLNINIFPIRQRIRTFRDEAAET